MKSRSNSSPKSKPRKEFETISDVQSRLSDSKPLLYKVYTKIKTIKEMYIYSSNGYSVTGLIHSDISKIETFPKKHSKTSKPKPIKLAWQMQQISPSKLEFVRACSPPVDLTSIFIKYGWDLHLRFNYTQALKMLFPIYGISQLDFSDQKNSALLSLLESLNIQNQESPKQSIIANLIDPDLNANYNVPKNEEKLKRKDFLWFPVEVLLRPDNDFKVLGEINNLPKIGNENLYELIFEVFGKMLPGFRLLGVLAEKNEEIVQVVVRARKIIVGPKTSFQRKWHLEGKNECILASGIYFCKVTDEGNENFAEFMMERIINECYTEDLGLYYGVQVPFDEKSGIVFLNTVPHYFFKINNFSAGCVERVYLEFFIVDPKKRLETNQIRKEVFDILKSISNLPKVLIDEILSFIFYFSNLNYDKKLIKSAKESKSSDESGWGYYENGYIGDFKSIKEFI